LPNHVNNQVTFFGKASDLRKLKKMLAMRQPIELSTGEYSLMVFNFHSIITPEKDEWADYNGPQPTKSGGDIFSHSTNHWYDWNIRNWGTKWNAYDEDCDDGSLEDAPDEQEQSLRYSFNTAWSPPENVIRLLAVKIKELGYEISFTWWYEEEQGWGGELNYNHSEDILEIIGQWDIPSSHAEIEDRGGSCWCYESNEKVWDDCPEEEEEEEEE